MIFPGGRSEAWREPIAGTASARSHTSSTTCTSRGPWTPTASFCSMSALRLGPVTIASALGRSSPSAAKSSSSPGRIRSSREQRDVHVGEERVARAAPPATRPARPSLCRRARRAPSRRLRPRARARSPRCTWHPTASAFATNVLDKALSSPIPVAAAEPRQRAPPRPHTPRPEQPRERLSQPRQPCRQPVPERRRPRPRPEREPGALPPRRHALRRRGRAAGRAAARAAGSSPGTRQCTRRTATMRAAATAPRSSPTRSGSSTAPIGPE